MTTIELRPAEMGDVPFIAEAMRQADRDEVWASHRLTPEQALRMSLQWSEDAWTVDVDGWPEVMLGVWRYCTLPSIGSPWLLGTEAVARHPKAMVQHARWVVPIMLSKYGLLRNAVHDRNEISKRFLGWLGFSMSDPVVLGEGKEPFRVFELRAPPDV
jgi:hypothetical protein